MGDCDRRAHSLSSPFGPANHDRSYVDIASAKVRADSKMADESIVNLYQALDELGRKLYLMTYAAATVVLMCGAN